MSANKPLDMCDVGGPHAGIREPLVMTPLITTDHGSGGGTCWDAIQSASDFMATPEPEGDFLVPRMLARGSLSLYMSPRGLGKTHVGHSQTVDLAKQGRRVLIIDRDNSRRELKRRLRGWGAAGLKNLKVLGRDDAPPLTDARAWAVFPSEYDLVLIDSFDSSAEGVGEQDSAKPSLALAPLLDIVHRADGPAILLCGNTVKTGKHGRGSGVVEDRADIVFEIRDATDLHPTGLKPWWQQLPPADRGSWADRAGRRKQRDKYRLAFISSKFRIGEEPEPFVLEVQLGGDKWICVEVTADLSAAGEQALTQAAREQSEHLERRVVSLASAVAERAASGSPMQLREDAEQLLIGLGMSRAASRHLIDEHDGKQWRIEGSGRRGHPKLLLPPGGSDSEDVTARKQKPSDPLLLLLEATPILADQEPCGPPESTLIETAPVAGGSDSAFRPSMDLGQGVAERWIPIDATLGASQPNGGVELRRSDPSGASRRLATDGQNRECANIPAITMPGDRQNPTASPADRSGADPAGHDHV